MTERRVGARPIFTSATQEDVKPAIESALDALARMGPGLEGSMTARPDVDGMPSDRSFAVVLSLALLFPGPTLEVLSDDEQELLQWARDRFEQAGLEYPRTRVVFYPDLTACDQRIGKYHSSEHTVHLCRHEKRDLLHELSHAWLDENLSGGARDRFRLARGLQTWGSHQVEWSLRATEHAAETLTWGLMDRNLLVRWVPDGPESYRLLTIPESSHEELVALFVMLTGQIPDERVLDRPVERDVGISPELARIP